MICYICNIGKYKKGKVNTPLNRDNKVILITDVPALVCDNCGFYLLEEEAIDITLKAANSFYKSDTQASIVSYDDLLTDNEFPFAQPVFASETRRVTGDSIGTKAIASHDHVGSNGAVNGVAANKTDSNQGAIKAATPDR